LHIDVVTFHFAKKAIKRNSATTIFLLATLALGILFVILQFVGFGQIVKMGIILQVRVQ
jgi:cytochrome c oxidase subunit 3